MVKSLLPNLDVKCCVTICMAFSPEIRITAIAPLPEGVANAMIGSLLMFAKFLMIVDLNKLQI